MNKGWGNEGKRTGGTTDEPEYSLDFRSGCPSFFLFHLPAVRPTSTLPPLVPFLSPYPTKKNKPYPAIPPP